MRAYICHARNDLEGHLLQVLDLKPNSSQPGNVLSPVIGAGVQSGQTGYLTNGAQYNTLVLTAAGAGAFTTSVDSFGLAAYLIDNVNNNTGADLALNANQANGIAAKILNAVATGANLTIDDINTLIRSEGADGGVAVDASSTLDGVGGTWSTGSVVEVLRILSGEAYKVPMGSTVIGAAGIFPGGAGHVKLGSFIARGTVGFRYVRRFYSIGALYRSVLGGALSKLVSPLFTWINTTFTYGATGTALTYAGTNIGTTGQARAVSVYEATGSVV